MFVHYNSNSYACTLQVQCSIMYDKPCIVFKHMRIHLKRARFQYSFKIIIPSVKTHTGCPKDFEEVSSGCPEILAIIKKRFMAEGHLIMNSFSDIIICKIY